MLCITGKKLFYDYDGDYFENWLSKNKMPFHTDKNLVTFSTLLENFRTQNYGKKHQIANKRSREEILKFLEQK